MKWNLSLPPIRRNRLIGLIAAAILITGGWFWLVAAARSPQREALRPLAVTHGTIEEVVTAQGNLEA